MGHDGGESPNWTVGHPEKVKDWGLRAHYSVATAAKALSAAFYDKPVRYSYFEGCSNGGRQAMMMAQNYPELFDGIVAGAPSMFYPDLLFWLLWTGNTRFRWPGQPPVLTDAKRARSRSACSRVRWAGRPRRRPDHQSARVQVRHRNHRARRRQDAHRGGARRREGDVCRHAPTESGVRRSPGAKPAPRPTGFRCSPTTAATAPSSSTSCTRATRRTSIGARARLLETYDEAKAALTPFTAAPSPDISAFVARGGKLLHYHGWNDAVVPPDGSIAYLYALTQFERLRNLPKADFDREVDKLTPQEVAATGEGCRRRSANTIACSCCRRWGIACSPAAGPSPSAAARTSRRTRTAADHHAVSAAIKWVEQGVAPEKIVASRFDATARSCASGPCAPILREARYKGSGDINDAASFTCVTPSASSVVEAGDMLQIHSSLAAPILELPNR